MFLVLFSVPPFSSHTVKCCTPSKDEISRHSSELGCLQAEDQLAGALNDSGPEDAASDNRPCQPSPAYFPLFEPGKSQSGWRAAEGVDPSTPSGSE